MTHYVPKRGLRNGHLMTVYCWGRPRQFPRLPPPQERFFDVEPGTRVLAHCHWQPDRSTRPALLALHGLESSSRAHYMRGLADKAFAGGFNVLLLNQRNCGGTEALSEGLYHSGLTADAAHVIREISAVDGISRVVAAGYSLGGNLALKIAGELGDAPHPTLRGVCAVSPVMELASCVDALERRQNCVYQWNFVRGLKARMRRKAQYHPERFSIDRLDDIRTVRQFDDVYTAPHFGFNGAADYYYRASAARLIDRIKLPALIVTAEDDPFVPVEPFRDPRLAANPHIRLVITQDGGHCGFLSDASNVDDDGYWAEKTIVEFAQEVTR
jgi:hypothetical protein